MTKETNLPATLQKSYYGKAKTRTTENGETVLKSYETDVCKITSAGDFVRLWGGYSRTTMNHVNDFRRLFGRPTLNKKAWESLPCENGSTERYKVRFSNGFVNWTAGAVFDNEEDAETFAENVEAMRGGRVYGYVVEV